ncbi:hypothetical protein CK203_051343 [Vitis vinifera]|uniref:Uncharacterized protein n=1 Tax=Vitis vinifera TaxID=29760 RepID=A0A438H3K4_VITVI|nr:hypothetical protein CK203_051343 [Vitis vinifera]
MKSPEKFPRFSSCRGVAFEIKPHSDPLPSPTPLVVDGRCGSNRTWNKALFMRKKEQKLVPVSFTSKREQPATVARQLESRLSIILLDQGPFTVYKRLFMAFLRVVFWLAVKVLGQSWVPLGLKTAITSLLQSLGGIHSGCGVSSVAWLVYALADETTGVLVYISHHRTHNYSMVTVRRVPVKVSAPSGHASIIKFEGGVKAGILGRISRSPLSEWHAFGIISDGKTEHMMLAGAVGDFTKSLVSDPPSHLWVRQVHFAGLPYLINMYDKVMMVATGSGICVFLSFLLQPCSADVCLVWVAKGIEHNFGREIKEIVNRYPKDKVIVHDTAVSGRPDIAQLSVDTAKNWGAQVVIVTSNPQGSRDVVNACRMQEFLPLVLFGTPNFMTIN